MRAYKPDPVEEEKLNRVLEAARLAPTAVNWQPFQLLVIHTKGRERLVCAAPTGDLCVWSRGKGMEAP